MGTRFTLTCPQCASTSCRESRWLTRSEKAAHPHGRPCRCLDCGQRFIFTVPRTRSTRALITALVASAVVLAGGMLLFTPLGEDDDVHGAVSVHSDEANGEEETRFPDEEKLRLAARAGDAEAQFRLGRAALLDHSSGVEGAEQAVSWLRKAAEQGHTGAMIQLGKLYRSGLGLAQNYEFAVRWIRAAAHARDPDGMVELGRLYRNGIGVERDAVQAYIWFNRAAAARHFDGAAERDSVALKLSAEELRLAQHHSLDVPPEIPHPGNPALAPVAADGR